MFGEGESAVSCCLFFFFFRSSRWHVLPCIVTKRASERLYTNGVHGHTYPPRAERFIFPPFVRRVRGHPSIDPMGVAYRKTSGTTNIPPSRQGHSKQVDTRSAAPPIARVSIATIASCGVSFTSATDACYADDDDEVRKLRRERSWGATKIYIDQRTDCFKTFHKYVFIDAAFIFYSNFTSVRFRGENNV